MERDSPLHSLLWYQAQRTVFYPPLLLLHAWDAAGEAVTPATCVVVSGISGGAGYLFGPVCGATHELSLLSCQWRQESFCVGCVERQFFLLSVERQEEQEAPCVYTETL